MLSSTYQFWGVHNLYQAKLAKLNIGEQSKVGLFFFVSFFAFCFSFIFFRYSFFAFHYSISLFVFHFFVFHLSYSLFILRFSFFIFDIQNRAEYRILTFKLRPNIVFLRSKSYFLHSHWGRISNFDIQNAILTFKLGPNIVF